MKKFLNLILAFVMVFSITGCGNNKKAESRKPVEVLSDTLKLDANGSVDEVKVDMTFSIKGSSDGVSYDSNINATISTLNDGTKTNVALELSDNPFIGALKGYVSISDTEMVCYIPSKIYNMLLSIENDENVYVKMVSEINNDDESIDEEVTDLTDDIDLEGIFTDDDFYLVSRTGDYGKYRLVVSKELLERIAKVIDSDVNDIFNGFDGSFSVDITIDEKNNRVTEISCDLTDYIKTNIGNMDLDKYTSISETIQKLSFDFKFQYSDVDASVPSDVINNSVLSEDYIEKYLHSSEYDYDLDFNFDE